MNARRLLVGAMIGLLCFATVNLASAQTNRTWTGSANGDWFNPTNWTPAGVPASNDTVNVGSGSINLTATVVIGAQFNWTGGTLAGSSLTIASNAVLNISGSGQVFVENAVTNAGTVNWTGTVGIYVYNNNASYFGSVDNLAGGVWNIQSDQAMNPGFANPYFNNAGTVIKSVTSGTTTFSVPFNNTGTVSNLTGTINFSGGGTIGGTFYAAATKPINFSSGNFTGVGTTILTGSGCRP